MKMTKAKMQKYLDVIRDFYNTVSLYDMKAKARMIEADLIELFDWMEDHPDETKSTERLTQQYLPMISKLLEDYTDLLSCDLSESMAEEVRNNVADLLNTTTIALDRFKENLYSNDMLDANVDMEVVKQLMTSDGLLGDDFRL